MYRDTTQLITADCYSILDDKTLVTYDGTSAITYKLVSNTYYETSTTTASSAPTGTTCYNQTQISELPSTWDFITPIYHSIAILSAIALFYIAYKLLIYPFYRNKI